MGQIDDLGLVERATDLAPALDAGVMNDVGMFTFISVID